ncbi:MAG: N-methyl-L-tryptophan oxidase [Vicinamibacterales bacterium]
MWIFLDAMNRFRTIVVGLGAMGSAALRHLAGRGHRALGIDRFSPPHAFGSSHGDTRITRLAIGEGAHYTPLALRSHALWRQLERETGVTLLVSTGGLFISSPAKSAVMHVPDFFGNTVAAARQYGIAHELLDAAAIRQRFPAFNVADDEHGYFEPEAGYLRPEACIAAQLAAAEHDGATIHRNETVAGFDASTGGITVATDRDRYTADRLIVAAGAWLPTLVGSSIARHFKVYRQKIFWLDVDGGPATFLPGSCPVFIWELQRKTQGIYGFPALDGPYGGVKVGTEQFTKETTADACEMPISAADIAAFHADLIAPFLPGLASRCVKAVTCLYTVTPDFGFVIDAHPDSNRVLIVAPCSGHGFKHSPAIGEAAAAWADEGQAPFGIDAFTLARFAPV